MGSTAVPLRLIPGGAPGTPSIRRVSFGPPASTRRPIAGGDPEPGRGPSSGARATVVDLAARRRATQLASFRRLLESIDGGWSALWRAYPGREREVLELHLRFDGARDAVLAWITGAVDVPPVDAIAAQLEGAAVLGAPEGAPARGAEVWRALCRDLEQLEHRVTTLDFRAPR